MFGEVRKNGEVRLGRERFGIMGGLVCHTKELGLYPIGSGEPWEDQGGRWVGGGEELSCSFESLTITDVLQVIHHLLECEN